MNTKFLSKKNHNLLYGILKESMLKKKSIKIADKYINLLSNIMKQVHKNSTNKSDTQTLNKIALNLMYKTIINMYKANLSVYKNILSNKIQESSLNEYPILIFKNPIY